MPLPIVPLTQGSVVIGGETVEYRALSRAEAMTLNGYRGREDEAEVFILMAGTGCSQDEAKAFREGNDVETAGALIDGILILSKLASDDTDPKAKSRGRS